MEEIVNMEETISDMEKEQEYYIDNIGYSLDIIKKAGEEMETELSQQNYLIEELTDQTIFEDCRIQKTTRDIDNLIDNDNSCSGLIIIILVLIIIVIGLILAIIYL
jgi:hypothetical protein